MTRTRKTALHPTTHKLLAKTLKVMATDAAGKRYQATLARLILLLESYGRKNPVAPDTIVGGAVWSLDTLGRDINDQWNFPPGKKYRTGDINSKWPVYTLAQDIDNRGGVVNGR